MNPLDAPTMGDHLDAHPEDAPCPWCKRDPDTQPSCHLCGGDGRRGAEIQACPVCHSEARQFNAGLRRDRVFWIRCTGPLCLSGPVRKSPHKAREVWNQIRFVGTLPAGAPEGGS